ncbi:MAG: hypothetical protein IKP26_06630 [Clostridia bacterium]|nr:hypothetical protein [Clostridia bacterium]
MDIEKLYYRVKEALSSLDIGSIWPGFEPLAFALYDSEKCFFDGGYVEKTDEFCANTSIVYHGRQIAVWMVQEELDTAVLASKLVHEMFHGFQELRGWSCRPNELEALFKYSHSAENLSVKLRENQILVSLLDRFDEAAYRELLSLRRLRSMRFPYEFAYESMVEEIEGSANYVEWQALKRLDPRAAQALEERMRAFVTDPRRLFPIRVACYFTGALMIHAMRAAGDYSFEPAERPAITPILMDVRPSSGDFPGKDRLLLQAERAVKEYRQATEAIVRAAVERNNVVLEGPCELTFLNVYDARRLDDYLTSTYFLAYRDGGGDGMLHGDFVILMKDERTISRVYSRE